MNEIKMIKVEKVFEYNYGEADYAIRQILKKKAAIEKLELASKQIKERRIREVDEWVNPLKEQLENEIEELSAPLRSFVESQLEGKKERSLKIVGNTVGLREGSITCAIGEDKVDGKSQKLLEIAKRHKLSEYIKVKEYADWAGMKKKLHFAENGQVVTDDGELIEDMKWTKEADKLYVKARE